MKKLTELPNIGSVLAAKLQQVEINSAMDLKNIGTEKAFLRIAIIDDSACINMLYALEGAIQGIKWNQISKERKKELIQFIHQIKK